ncbi:NADPH-dependent FMN reductase [Agilicoccus flavus]|uniref:NADPH-dependent FMN reductase n=1 Tax=Agilicoccus flavus TaxID=2775968 RepID=UPI001CF6D583|nr:NAD(P)H-dependent oxidoreductase [Agilicoccus flavus]
MHVLVFVGSLRADSANRRLARAAAAHLPADATAEFYDGLEALPFYSEELDVPGALPDAVEALRAAVARADALIVVTPEYNGSMAPVVHNAIDWASRPRGSAALAGLPTAVLAASGSPRGAQWARESAVRVLGVAGADVLPDHVGIPSAHAAFEDDRIVDADLDAAVAGLVAALRSRRAAA